jgi:hypothetical protein
MAGEIVIGKQFFHKLDQTLNAVDVDTNQMMSLLISLLNQNRLCRSFTLPYD